MKEEQKERLARTLSLVLIWSVILWIGATVFLRSGAFALSSYLLSEAFDSTDSRSAAWCYGQIKKLELFDRDSWAVRLVDDRSIDTNATPVAILVINGQWDRFTQAKTGDVVLFCSDTNAVTFMDSIGTTYKVFVKEALPGDRGYVSLY